MNFKVITFCVIFCSLISCDRSKVIGSLYYDSGEIKAVMLSTDNDSIFICEKYYKDGSLLSRCYINADADLVGSMFVYYPDGQLMFKKFNNEGSCFKDGTMKSLNKDSCFLQIYNYFDGNKILQKIYQKDTVRVCKTDTVHFRVYADGINPSFFGPILYSNGQYYNNVLEYEQIDSIPVNFPYMMIFPKETGTISLQYYCFNEEGSLVNWVKPIMNFVFVVNDTICK